MAVINVHTHFQPEAALDVVAPYGIEMTQDNEQNWTFRSGNLEYRVPGIPENFWGRGLGRQVAQMDANGVDVHVLAPSPMVFGYHLDAEVNALFSRTFNDETARLMAEHPGRFWGSAHLPMQDLERAVAELEHAVEDLGFRGCSLDYVIGRDSVLGDRRCDPFLARVEALDVPMLLHPVALGQTLDLDAAGGTWLLKHQVDYVWGYLFGEAAAVVGLILSGALDRFPRLRFVVPHGGGMIPYQIGRLRMQAERFASSEDGRGLERSIDEYLRDNFFFDTVLHDPRSLRFLISVMGPENVVMGTNYPGWDQLPGWEMIRSLEGVPEAEKEAVLGLNAERRLFA